MPGECKEELRGAYVMTSSVRFWPKEDLQAVLDEDMILRTWGDAYGYAMVATGRAEAMIDARVSIWDIAPIGVTLSEAGGRFTELIAKYPSGARSVSGNGPSGPLVSRKERSNRPGGFCPSPIRAASGHLTKNVDVTDTSSGFGTNGQLHDRLRALVSVRRLALTPCSTTTLRPS